MGLTGDSKKSIIQGVADDGTPIYIPVTGEGHLEVAVHSPRLPFGSLHTEKITPIFQTDAVYGLNGGQVISGSTLTGSASASDSNFVCSTGTTVYSQAFIQGRRRLRYRPGQGVIGRFSAVYTTPAASSYQVVGFGHAEDGVYFGYKDTDFGILRSVRGVRETRTLTITTGATGAGNLTITLNGTAFTVPVTGASNIQRTVWEIFNFTYTGWKTSINGATVIFIADSVGALAGAFTLGVAQTGTVGTFALTKAGAATTETFITQPNWNGDKLDGTGASGATIDPTKGNVFQIGIQYLGYGSLTFSVEVCSPDGNNAEWVVVHTIRLPNTLTTTSFGNPSFPFSMAVYSAGSTTNLTIKVGSFAGFIEGDIHLIGNRFSYVNTLTTVGATNYQALFTVLNTRYYKGRTSQAVVNLLSISAALKHTQPCNFYLIKNGVLSGNPNFANYATDSVCWYDTAATTVALTTNDQLVFVGSLGETGDFDFAFTDIITLQPGEWITLAAKAVVGTPTYVTGSINTREDQ